MDNNKRKPKLVAEHPAACRRRWDGAAATWATGRRSGGQ